MRLSHSLASTLRKLSKYDMDEGFGVMINAGKSPIEDLPPKRVISDIAELRDAGMLKIFEYPKGHFDSFTLTSRGRDYQWDRLVEVSTAVARSAFQFLCGAAGGLVVWALTRAFG